MKIAIALGAISFGAALASGCGGSTVGGDPGSSDAGPSRSSSRASDDAAAAQADASTTGMAPPAINVSCESSRTCPPSQLCCATVSLGGAGGLDVACATTCGPLGFQVCASSAECTTSGDVCTSTPLLVGSYCAPARDAGALVTVDSGVTEEAGATDAGTLVDAGALDAGTLADAGGPDAETLADAGALDAGTLADAAPIDAAASAPGDAAADDAAAPFDAEAADDGTFDAAVGDAGPGDDSSDIDAVTP